MMQLYHQIIFQDLEKIFWNEYIYIYIYIMTIDDQIKDEKFQYDINRLTEQPYYQAKLISMNILQVKKYCLLIKKNKRTS